MSVDRLFQMIHLLMERSPIPAKELAEKFEVSIRTIYRDLDVLSGAGIPVYALPGRGGGISLLPGYVLDILKKSKCSCLWESKAFPPHIRSPAVWRKSWDR